MLQKILDALPLKFKTEKQRRELYSGKADPRLLRLVAFIALWAFRKYGRSPEITEVYRTEDEQRALYPNDAAKKSVHQFWRGCDVVVRGLDPSHHREIRDTVNLFFPYGKPIHRTCIYHDAGSGWHLHLQVRG